MGHTLFQIITEADQPVAVLVWAASAYHLKDRDAWIGWDKLTCATRRNLMVNSLHTHAENAHAIVSQKGGDYIAALKDNQPTLHALAHQKLDGTTPLGPSAKRPAALPASAALAS